MMRFSTATLALLAGIYSCPVLAGKPIDEADGGDRALRGTPVVFEPSPDPDGADGIILGLSSVDSSVEGQPLILDSATSMTTMTTSACPTASAAAIISNGVIKLGVNPYGNLVVNGTVAATSGGNETRVGLRLVNPTAGESEGIAFGRACEARD